MKHELGEIGLSPTEVKIYLALLDLGETKVSEILKKAEINSGRIYDVLSGLENKGFVSKIIKKKVKYYVPSPPSIIKDYLKEKRNQISMQERNIAKILPDLMERYSSIKSKTKVEVFMGIEGMKTAYELLFKEAKKSKELYVIGITEIREYPKEILNLLEFSVYKRRKELKLITKKIVDINSKNETFYQKDNSQIRYINLPSLTSMEIIGDYLLIQIFKDETIGILIHNKHAAEDFKKQFMEFWKQAKP